MWHKALCAYFVDSSIICVYQSIRWCLSVDCNTVLWNTVYLSPLYLCTSIRWLFTRRAHMQTRSSSFPVNQRDHLLYCKLETIVW